MFRKIFGTGSSKSKRNRLKRKRLSQLSHESTGPRTGGGEFVVNAPPPSYQYAMNEYALTAPNNITRRRSSDSQINVDDDGQIRPSYSMAESIPEEAKTEFQQLRKQHQFNLAQNNSTKNPNGHEESVSSAAAAETTTTNDIDTDINRQQHSIAPPPPPPPPGQPSKRDGILRPSSEHYRRYPNVQPQLQSNINIYASNNNGRRILSPRADYLSYDEDDTGTTATFGDTDDDEGSTGGPSMMKEPIYDHYNQYHNHSSSNGNVAGIRNGGRYQNTRGNFEPMMPDSTYEEWYGDAYVGGPIRYVYPSGYQSMRPRGGPWKLSIVVCLLFTWLSVFVIGHCSDIYTENQATQNNANDSNNNNNNNDDYTIDDDNFVINAKWCGSRLLYWLWVVSMLITGLATAYCSVIGYIKVRDFAVANTRSQPPGIMIVGDQSIASGGNSRRNNIQWGGITQGNSDYYVRIGEANNDNNLHNNNCGSISNAAKLQQIHPAHYNKTIYQADGTPQFWGNQIYRPTQAAVAITSR